jgi:predicted aconitase with swiveling domain
VVNTIPKLGAAVAKLFNIDGNNGIEELDLLADKVRMTGGIRAAIEKLSGQPIGGKSLVLPNNDGGTKCSSHLITKKMTGNKLRKM